VHGTYVVGVIGLAADNGSELSLGLGGPGMASSAPVSGPSVLVDGGSYAYTVGPGQCSFTLTVTSAAP
jgi:hypothetical protein